MMLGDAVKQERDSLLVDANGEIWGPDEVMAQWDGDLVKEVVWIEGRICVQTPDGYAGEELLRVLSAEEASIARAGNMERIGEVRAWMDGR